MTIKLFELEIEFDHESSVINNEVLTNLIISFY